MDNLSPSVQRFLAASLLLLIVLALYFYVAMPVAAHYGQKWDAVALTKRQLNQYRFLIENEDAINRELSRIETANESGDLFLSGAKPAIASANLRDFIGRAVQKSGGQLVSSQEYEAEPVAATTPVGLRIQVSGEVDNLMSLLYELESARPVIFVDELIVTSSSSRIRNSRVSARRSARRIQAGSDRDSLDIRMDIVGFLAGSSP